MDSYAIDLAPDPAAAARRGFDQRAYALSAACDELEEIGAHAVARPTTTGGWIVDIHNPHGAPANVHLQLDPTDSGRFPANSAGHRLIEHGWTTRPCAHYAADRTAGWKEDLDTPGLWTAPVIVDPEST